MSKVLYQLFIRLYPFVVRLAAPFNKKAKLWVKGREQVFERMSAAISPTDSLVWMHCSSLGEFEQGRPLIEKIRADFPGYKILLTFFSPSGYEVRKDYKGADYIFYLPADNKENATVFLEITKPRLILFIKYEFWYYYLNEAKKRNIPLLLVSAIFRKHEPFFSKHGYFQRSMLLCFNHLFVQNEESLSLLSTINISQNVTVSGDTRFDRVAEIAEQFKPIPVIETFCYGSNVIVAGSTWSEDDKKMSQYLNSANNIKCIIAPHNISAQRLNECLKLYNDSILFSAVIASGLPAGINTIIIDNVGMLSRLYKYATVNYIGGGFGTAGVHNVLEAAVYGKPVIFGPVYKKYIEVAELVNNKGGVSVKSYVELEEALNEFLKKGANYINMCEAASSYVCSKLGATEKIISFIQENRLLTN